LTLVVVLPLPPFWFAMANVLMARLSPSSLSTRRQLPPGPNFPRALPQGAADHQSFVQISPAGSPPNSTARAQSRPLGGRRCCGHREARAVSLLRERPHRAASRFSYSLNSPCHNRTGLSTCGLGCGPGRIKIVDSCGSLCYCAVHKICTMTLRKFSGG
jgi:hypothetical protein